MLSGRPGSGVGGPGLPPRAPPRPPYKDEPLVPGADTAEAAKAAAVARARRYFPLLSSALHKRSVVEDELDVRGVINVLDLDQTLDKQFISGKHDSYL